MQSPPLHHRIVLFGQQWFFASADQRGLCISDWTGFLQGLKCFADVINPRSLRRKLNTLKQSGRFYIGGSGRAVHGVIFAVALTELGHFDIQGWPALEAELRSALSASA
eukprot:1937631-Lingulodinium_polyedra.AAC.1